MLERVIDRAFARVTPHTLHLAPFAAMSATPTVAQLLNASNAEYVLGGVPAGMHAFTVWGVPISYTNPVDGVSAQV